MADIQRHILTVQVDNEAGVLARVVGLFSARGYNIESLTVAETDSAQHTSRITIVTSGTPAVVEQIEAQLRRLVPVHRVINWTSAEGGIEREMVLVKLDRAKQGAAIVTATAHGARTLDTGDTALVFEITEAPSKVDAFIAAMRPLGLLDVSRTGVAAISRDADAV